MNQFGVGAVGKKIHVTNLAPQPRLDTRDALELAAYLAAAALSLQPGDAQQNLGRFLKQIAEAAGEGEVSEAVAKELEE